MNNLGNFLKKWFVYTPSTSYDFVLNENNSSTNVTDLYDAMVAMTPIDVVLAKSTGVEGENGITTWTAGNSFGFKGKATITSLEISAQNGEYATFSITLAGTGALKKVSEV